MATGGVIGFVAGKLSSGDLRALLSQLLEGSFKFLHEQGSYASFALVMVMFFGALSVWCIKTLVEGKQGEIDRMAAERDKFQAPFLEHWRSTHKEKGPGTK